MQDILIQAVNLSISASYLVLAVLLLRPLLKKAPRWISVALWGLVGLRLVFPFSIESMLSLLPSGQTIPPDIAVMPNPGIQSGLPVVDDGFQAVFDQLAPVVTPNAPAVTPMPSANPLETWLLIGALVWVAGIVCMLGYTTVSYLRLRRQVFAAVRVEGNAYRSERIASPFVLGLVRPRIYLPTGLSEAELPYVIAHERSHIARRDHWIKPLGFVLLSLYWFNPVLWLAYVLLCRDIEMACDERVISSLETGLRIDYSQALLSCSVSRRSIAACPLAFGEVSVKHRIKRILSYKHPGFWITLVSLVLCVVLAVSFLTDPVEAEKDGPTASQTQPSEPAPAPTDPTVPPATQQPTEPEKEPLPPLADIGSDGWDVLVGRSYKEVEALFGVPGTQVGWVTLRYYWMLPNGHSVFVSFERTEGAPIAMMASLREAPIDPESTRQQLLELKESDIDRVTVTTMGIYCEYVTADVPWELAMEAIRTFQDCAKEASYEGLNIPDAFQRNVEFLTIYTKDGQQLTVEFYTLLHIGEYWFSLPSDALYDRFHGEHYRQLLGLLAEELRQTVRSFLPGNLQQLTIHRLPNHYSAKEQRLDREALLAYLNSILGECVRYNGRSYLEGKTYRTILVFSGGVRYEIVVTQDGYIHIDRFVYKVNTYPGWWEDLEEFRLSQ